jgi:hypothetical protein
LPLSATDSGGPQFLDGVLVSITVTGDRYP